MIAGQTLDLRAEGRSTSAEELTRLHSLKTGQLILAPVKAACALAKLDAATTHHFEIFAEKLGLAFQIQDDILDVVATSSKLGKSIGKDQRDQKTTYVTIYGLERARELLAEVTIQAQSALSVASDLGYDTSFLKALSDYLLVRDH